MKGGFKLVIQKVARRAGYHIRKLEPDTSLVDPYQEQRRLASGAQVIFEVGAADGRDCELYRQMFPGSVVHAFEPLPDNFAKLAKRAEADPSIVAYQMALSDQVGSARFHVSEWADASSLLPPKDTGSTFDTYQASKSSIEVKTMTLDAIADQRRIAAIDILKMDAQGAELAILQGGAKLLAAGKIRMVYTEAQFRPLYHGAGTFDRISVYLSQYGFTLHNLFNINHNQRGEACWCDALFVREGT
jgi:FkbM family methyltransferase